MAVRAQNKMNYHRVYERLIERRRREPLDKKTVYCERHHFIPRCMGGTNESWNLVYLTAKEHFIAHHLLYLMNPTNISLMSAFMAMCANPKGGKRSMLLSARRHGKLREAYAEKKRAMFAAMSPEDREKRRKNIKAACEKRSPEATARKVERWKQSYMSRSDEAKQEAMRKRKATEAARTPERQKEISEIISKAQRKMSEELELRVVAEYESGKTAREISEMPWCELCREGVNYLLRRRGIVKHIDARWIGLEQTICEEYRSDKYPTRDALAKAYDTSWAVIKRILLKNGVELKLKNPRLAAARYANESRRLMGVYVSYSSPFSKTEFSCSLYDAIERLKSFGMIPKEDIRRKALRRIRASLDGHIKFAYGYSWRKIDDPKAEFEKRMKEFL